MKVSGEYYLLVMMIIIIQPLIIIIIDDRETAYSFQRISVAIPRFNSVLLHDTLIVDSPDL